MTTVFEEVHPSFLTLGWFYQFFSEQEVYIKTDFSYFCKLQFEENRSFSSFKGYINSIIQVMFYEKRDFYISVTGIQTFFF